MNIANVTDYISIWGMFEIRRGSKYEVYDNKTKNLYDWKKYNTSLRLNQHGLIEMLVDLQDVTLMGTKNFIDNIPEVLNRMQVRANTQNILFDAYKYCTEVDAACNKTVQTSFSRIFNDLISFYYKDYNKLSTK